MRTMTRMRACRTAKRTKREYFTRRGGVETRRRGWVTHTRCTPPAARLSLRLDRSRAFRARLLGSLVIEHIDELERPALARVLIGQQAVAGAVESEHTDGGLGE